MILYGERDLDNLGNAAHSLHKNFYLHPSMLRRERIAANIGRVESLVNILAAYLSQ